MSEQPPHQITGLLRAWRSGDRAALDQLMPVVYAELHRLAPGLTEDPRRKRSLIREARASSALNHPNIVTIYDIDQADGIDYIAIEYIPGKILSESIPREGMELSLALRFAVQIANALGRADAAGLIHRDLKPGNIIVGEDGRIRVLDFGLAKLTETLPPGDEGSSAPPASWSEAGAIAGTAPYMSPEQVQGKAVDKRSDIFSFGSTHCEMVTGRCAFQGDSKGAALPNVLHAEPEPITGRVPPDLDRIIHKCLRKEPEGLYQHIEEVKSELEDLLEASESPRSTKDLRAGWKRSKFAWAASGTLVLAFVAALTWWLAARFVGTRPTAVVKPLTAYPGLETSPSLSPDGRQVAFSWNGEKQDNWDIYVQQVTGGGRRRLTADAAADLVPAWSPTRGEIAFLRNTPLAAPR